MSEIQTNWCKVLTPVTSAINHSVLERYVDLTAATNYTTGDDDNDDETWIYIAHRHKNL